MPLLLRLDRLTELALGPTAPIWIEPTSPPPCRGVINSPMPSRLCLLMTIFLDTIIKLQDNLWGQAF